MHVSKLHPIFAAELQGVDTAKIDRQLIDTVEALMQEHVVLCIRDQGHISDEQHLAFARAFGPLELPGAYRADTKRRIAYGLYDASNLDVDGNIVDPASLRAKFAKGNELFHADSSFNDMPSKWSMLRGVIVPPERGDTQFVDLRHVYDALPAEKKAEVEHLLAEHSFVASRIKGGASSDEVAQIKLAYPGTRQPMVRISPSGRKALFIGSHAYRVEGMSDEAGAALIDELLKFASEDRFIYSHKWQQGDLIIWDNRCALHRGTEFDYERYRRDLRRANVNEHGQERSATADLPATM
jgi:alpha-ketoglutarate-dependent 2,4-dichlorophenoxyacetate dioxygenase